MEAAQAAGHYVDEWGFIDNEGYIHHFQPEPIHKNQHQPQNHQV